jgi:hypothetical protein
VAVGGVDMPNAVCQESGTCAMPCRVANTFVR